LLEIRKAVAACVIGPVDIIHELASGAVDEVSHGDQKGLSVVGRRPVVVRIDKVETIFEEAMLNAGNGPNAIPVD
jgi:hypothetical protein